MLKNINELNSILNQNTNHYLSGITKDFEKFLLSYMAEKSKKDCLIILNDDTSANKLSEFMHIYVPNVNTYYFPSFGGEPYQKTAINKSIITQRINTLCNCLVNDHTQRVVITSTLGLLQKTIATKYLKNRFFKITTKLTLELEELVDFLISNNYTRTSLVVEEGQFSIRGGIIDIYTPNMGTLRIDLFDNVVEKIKKFDVYSQKTTEIIDMVTINPSCEILLYKETIDNFKYNYKTKFGQNDTLFQLIENKIMPTGIENYLSFFYDETASIVNYLNAPDIFIYEDCIKKISTIVDNYKTEYAYRVDNNNIFKSDKDIVPVAQLLLSTDDASNILNNNRVITLNSFKNDKYNSIDFNIVSIKPLLLGIKQEAISDTLKLINIINNNQQYKFIIFVTSEIFLEQLITNLKEQKLIYSFTPTDNLKITILYSLASVLDEGFTLNDTIVLCESEITGVKKTFSTKRINPNKILRHLSSIEQNDIIVHENHGIGQYKGINTINANGIEHDFLEIWYQNNEKLYVPVENIDLISRYGSADSEVLLDKLGSKTFEKRNLKIKDQIKDIAYDLIKIAANRKLKKAPIIDINKVDYDKFLAKFPYVETTDQLNTINDVVNDLISGYPADRLICGDVGFGKTEVAMRAAFLIANSGYQVAIITPTTLLCNQHYNNFYSRFSDTAIKVQQLSRFVTPKVKNTIKEEIASGEVDIIIGTHALLSNDIVFKNIGLIIVDEEQSFGVIHKEKLKALKEEVHIITLSATPIPRTTQLAFKGIKDLSLITTPPVDKLPISTYIMPVDYLSIKKAINKEIERGGQIYFVCPKISDIHSIIEMIDSLGTNCSYIFAHGQLSSDNLEKNMLDFQNKKYDMLISTNIIESGLDLPNVNTIIIFRSEIFGISQLYQLRGRVGRSNIQSFAYLLYDDKKPLTYKAEKRLQLLQQLDYLGAGFSLASYDLDMRGAGNLLGEEQSGHIKEIGSEMYQKLLEKEINYLRNSNVNTDYDNFNPNINLNIPILIPKKYIPDIQTSMEMYQRIGQIKNILEIQDIVEEMEDRFGTLPYQVTNLLKSIELKIHCRKANVEKLIFGNKGVSLNFYNNVFPNVANLLAFIETNKQLLSIKPNSTILINTENQETPLQIQTVIKILQDLSNLLSA